MSDSTIFYLAAGWVGAMGLMALRVVADEYTDTLAAWADVIFMVRR